MTTNTDIVTILKKVPKTTTVTMTYVKLAEDLTILHIMNSTILMSPVIQVMIQLEQYWDLFPFCFVVGFFALHAAVCVLKIVGRKKQ